MSRLTLLAITTLLFGCLLAACSRKEPVRIGMMAGMSGRVADLGIAGRNGVMLAVEERNAAGGLGGRPIELLVRDDEQNPDVAGKAVEELLASRVEVIVGPMTSSIATAVLPRINASGVILVSPTVTSSALAGKDDNFFRVCGDTRAYAEKTADFQYLKWNRRSVAAIYDLDNRAYSEVWLGEFTARFEKHGGKVMKTHGFHSGASPAFLEPVRRMLAVKPDLMLVIANSVDAGVVCQHIRKLAPTQAIALSEWPSTERFVELAGAAAEGAFVSQFFNRESTSPRYRSFRDAYLARFGGQEPGFAAIAGYDAARVAFEALEKRRQGETLKQALLRIGRFNGVQQEFAIDRFGDASRPTFISVVRDGRYRTLEP